jgi:hypothetical protein
VATTAGKEATVASAGRTVLAICSLIIIPQFPQFRLHLKEAKKKNERKKRFMKQRKSN